MGIIRAIPLTAYLLIIYNVIAFAGGSRPGVDLEMTAFSIPLTSGVLFTASVGDLLLMVGMAALYIEIFKATRSSDSSIVDHFLSMLVFVAFLVEFLLVPQAATPTFFILSLMAFLDVVAGFTVTISTSRRDFTMGEQ
ncbi:MAG: hypothetical protein HQL52_08690 [Magnetococcales bacterium]|nr:hypothetical protein [Magnetococcales bacterium]